MIYLQLFLTFLKIGAVSFGGGYGMIPLIREEVLSAGWLTDGELMNFIAVSESTPGPIAVNMATFVGSSQGGFLGAFAATLGVVLPSFAVILLIASLLKKFMRYKGVEAALAGIRPVIAGLITGTAAIMLLSCAVGIGTVSDKISPDLYAIAIFALLSVAAAVYYKLCRKTASPIAILIFSGILGVIFYL